MKEKLHQLADIGISWAGALATITLTQISLVVSIAVGAVTCGFTIHRWIYWHRTKKDE